MSATPTMGRIVEVFVNDAWHAGVVSEVPSEFAPHLVQSADGPDVEALAIVPFPQTADFDKGTLRTLVWCPKDEAQATVEGNRWRWPPRV